MRNLDFMPTFLTGEAKVSNAPNLDPQDRFASYTETEMLYGNHIINSSV